MRPAAWGIAGLIVGLLAGIYVGGSWPPSGSSIGFALTYNLAAATEEVTACTSASGINTLALPYIREAGVDDAQQLIDDIDAEGGVALNVQRYNEATDSFEVYPDASGSAPFSLVAGEALLVQMETGVDYRMIGSHDPTVALSLQGPSFASSASGINFIALPYHSTAANALDLINDIGASHVENVQRYNEATDTWEVYEPGSGATPFDIVPGEGYLVKMIDTVLYAPSHY